MNIGMLSDTFLPIYGGAEIHVLELSRALHKLGHRVQICTALEGERVADGFPVLRIPALRGGHWRAFLRLPFSLSTLMGFIRAQDIVHCHYSFLFSFIGTILAKIAGVPSIVTLHGLGTLDSSTGRSWLRRMYRRVSLRLADHVIATSDEMRSIALRYTSEDKVTIVPNGVDTELFDQDVDKPRGATEDVIVLSMRRLAPKNGVQYLIDAIPYVLQRDANVNFWIAGEGKLEPYLRERVAELGVERNVRFIGIVPHNETREYYSQADIVAFPSSAESTSLACLEAMAMRRAVVASALAPFRLMLGDGERGSLVRLFDRESSDYNAPLNLPQDRIEKLADAISLLVQNPALRSELGDKARAFAVENFDWQVVAGQVVTIYDQLIASMV
jgi:1,2-diacylglycerol 3-alpha-glucosyltransferase